MEESSKGDRVPEDILSEADLQSKSPVIIKFSNFSHNCKLTLDCRLL
jgi:hypothetical protein